MDQQLYNTGVKATENYNPTVRIKQLKMQLMEFGQAIDRLTLPRQLHLLVTKLVLMQPADLQNNPRFNRIFKKHPRISIIISMMISFFLGCFLLICISKAFLVIVFLSTPYISFAVIMALIFQKSIVGNPVKWAVSAIIITSIIACIFYGNAGLLSLIVSVPASLIFVTGIKAMFYGPPPA